MEDFIISPKKRLIHSILFLPLFLIALFFNYLEILDPHIKMYGFKEFSILQFLSFLCIIFSVTFFYEISNRDYDSRINKILRAVYIGCTFVNAIIYSLLFKAIEPKISSGSTILLILLITHFGYIVYEIIRMKFSHPHSLGYHYEGIEPES